MSQLINDTKLSKKPYQNKILYNKRNDKISTTLDANLIIKGIFKKEFINKYSILRTMIFFLIPLGLILGVLYLVIQVPLSIPSNDVSKLKPPFIATSIVVIILYIVLYLINFNRIFYFLNWVLIKKKKVNQNNQKTQFTLNESSIEIKSKPNQQYLHFYLNNKDLLENKIEDTFISINNMLLSIKTPYVISADNNGMHLYAKDLNEIIKHFEDANVFKFELKTYKPEVDLYDDLNYYNFDYRKLSYSYNDNEYGLSWFNINKLQHSVNLVDIANHKDVVSVHLFSKPFVLTKQKKNDLNENINALQEETQKNNTIKVVNAANDIQNTINVLSNIVDEKTGVVNAGLLIIYKKSTNLKDLLLKYNLHPIKEYYQTYELLKNIQNDTIYESNQIFDEVSCFHIANLLLTPYKQTPKHRDNDLLIGLENYKNFYFNNLITTELNPNRNGMVVGTSGGGKSYFMHQLISYNNQHNVKCILIDPNNQINNLKDSNDFDITNTPINLMYYDKNNNLEEKINTICNVFNLILENDDKVMWSELKVSLKEFYLDHINFPQHHHLRYVLTYLNHKPLVLHYLQKLVVVIENNQKLKNLFDENTRDVVLNKNGSLNLLFPIQEYTKINATMEDKVVLYVMWDLIFDYVFKQYNLVADNKDISCATMIYVDEAQNFFNDTYLNVLDKLSRELRKFKSGIWFFTQTFSALVENSKTQTKDIFANCSHKFIFKQESNQVKVIVDHELFGSFIDNTNKTIKDVANNLSVGQCLYFNDDIHYIDKKYTQEDLEGDDK